MRHWLFSNLANFITAIRFLGTIYLGYLFIFWPDCWIRLIITSTICALSDFIDGTIAYRLRIQSKFGAAFDTLSDKLFVGVTFLAMIFIYLPVVDISVFLTTLTSILLLMLVLLEAGLILGSMAIFLRGFRNFQSVEPGKLKMDFESLTIFILIPTLGFHIGWQIEIFHYTIYLVDICLRSLYRTA